MTIPGGFHQAYPVTSPVMVPLTAAGNSPLGCQIINRGDNKGTILIAQGDGAPTVTLGPSGSLVWTDREHIPYAGLAPGSPGPETALVSSSVGTYTDPTGVAAATAAQILASGVPTVYSYDLLYSGNPPAVGAQITQTVDVSHYATVILQAVAELAQTPPPLAPWLITGYFDSTPNHSLPEVVLAGQFGNEETTLSVPVGGKNLVLASQVTAPSWLTVIGSNRPTNRQHITPTPAAYYSTLSNSLAAGSTYPVTSAPSSLACDGPMSVTSSNQQAGNWLYQGWFMNRSTAQWQTGLQYCFSGQSPAGYGVRQTLNLPRQPVALFFQPAAAMTDYAYMYTTDT